jgi:glycosyltransferase involved in cell wall biosynthesis
MSIKDKKKEIFFTIIIPTRERSDTLMHTLKTALSQDYDEFQVIVSDNASEDDTREKVTLINDPRLKYVNTGQRVSMGENWEFALGHVNKGWITVLGDDDALLPGTLCKVNEIINETGTKAIRSNGCQYRWPGFHGSLYGELSTLINNGYEIRDSRQMLQQVLDGLRNYNELPMLYNGGFMSLELVKQVKDVTKKFFLSMTPDVYSAIVFSLITDNYIYSNEPLAINGASLHSGGTASFEKNKQKRSYDPVEKFWNEKNNPFHEDIPLLENGRPVRSIQVIVYEAYLQAEKFHAYKHVLTDHVQQLKLVLKKSGPDHLEIIEWATLFARKHKLDIPRKSILSSVFYGFNRIFNRLNNILHSYSMKGSTLCPLENVADASVVAGALKQISPSIFSNFMRRIQGWMKNV